MNAKNAYTECVRRTGQRGVSMGTFPGWHVLGTGIGRDDTTALVKSDADARLYAASPTMKALIEEYVAGIGSICGANNREARFLEDIEDKARAILASLARGS